MGGVAAFPATGAHIVDLLQSIVAKGVPYVYGGTSMSGFDCSGLVQYVYGQAGFNLPRTSEEQASVGKAVQEHDLQPGDLILSQWPGDDASPGHVAIYAGGGTLIEAPHTGENVHQIALDASYKSHVTGYRRVTGVADAGGSGLGSVASGIGDAVGGLISWPSDITSFFSKATDDLAATSSWFAAFTRPSTYVRMGSGLFGFIFLAAGLYFLVREAKSP